MKRLTRGTASLAIAATLATLLGCSGSDEPPVAATVPPEAVVVAPGEAPAFVADAIAALDAVEAELGAGQEYFEVTANAQFTNVFVAVDDGTAAVAYAFVGGELQQPAPKQTGAEGLTFVRADVDFDPELVVAGAQTQLPSSSIDALSIYGDGFGATYVLAATSEVGGFLDIVVGPDGQVFSVDPQ